MQKFRRCRFTEVSACSVIVPSGFPAAPEPDLFWTRNRQGALHSRIIIVGILLEEFD